MPLVSVILPVYNGLPYIRESIDSILNQTFRDFELIIVNDGSIDGSENVIDSYSDNKIIVINQENQGLAKSLNNALRIAKGEYIARQDADDISMPNRLKLEVEFLNAHPECGIVGSWSKIWHENTPTNRGHHHPSDNGTLQFLSIFDSFFVHSSVMARKSIIDLAGGYPLDPERNPPEDFDLWSRMRLLCELRNIPVPLVIYRELSNSISREKAELIQDRVHKIACENLFKILDNKISHEVCSDFVCIIRGDNKRISRVIDFGLQRLVLTELKKKLQKNYPKNTKELESVSKKIFLRLLCKQMTEKITLRIPILERIVNKVCNKYTTCIY